jgi:hypothetical protein
MSKFLSGSYFNVSHKGLLICFVLSSPSLSFRHYFASFDLAFMQVFERLLGPCSLECPKTPLVCWQVSLPIYSGGISFIFTKTIVLTVYLMSWALVIPINTFRFLMDSCTFLLEAIRASSLGSLPFKMQLMLFQKLFAPVVITYLPHS